MFQHRGGALISPLAAWKILRPVMLDDGERGRHSVRTQRPKKKAVLEKFIVLSIGGGAGNSRADTAAGPRARTEAPRLGACGHWPENQCITIGYNI